MKQRALPKRFSVWLLAACLLLSATAVSGCSDKRALAKQDVAVWTATSAVKYEKSVVTAEETCALTYDVVRNEYESRQILIAPKKNVRAYSLQVTDLKCGDDIIAAKNITVYNERYVYINSGADSTVYGQGYYPDALVPIEAAAAAGELTVQAGENAALWVTLYVPKTAAAGTYTANFTLTLDNLIQEIPVTVHVADYTLSDEIHAKSSFTWRYNRVGSGEMDYTTEMFDTYFRFFQDYRISLENPVVDFTTGEEYVAALIENWDKMTNYTFNPYWGELGATDAQFGVVAEQIRAVAAASNAARNLFDKAMFYFIDEPELSDDAVLRQKTTQLQSFNRRLKNLVAEIAADDSGRYEVFRRIENWQDCILGIPNVVTVDLEDLSGRMQEDAVIAFLSECNCLCPVWRNVSISDFSDMVKSMQDDYGIAVWWYGCVQPTAPYANYHIGDTNLLNTRSIAWLQHKYGIDGNLYWDAAAYTSYAEGTYGNPVDVYESPYRAVGANNDIAGDGFLTYPGAKYGLYGPIPSMRLMGIRDGMEDYELLYDLHNKYASVADAWDTTAAQMLQRLYEGLYYNGSMMMAEGDNGLRFDALRAELIDLLVSFGDDTKFYITDVRAEKNRAIVRFTADSDLYDVYMGTEQIQPQNGNAFVYGVPLSGDGFYTFRLRNKQTGVVTAKKRYLATGVRYLLDFDAMQEVPSGIILSENSQAYVNTNDRYKTSEHSLGLTVSSKITGNAIRDLLYEVQASLSANLFGVNFGKAVYVHLDIYNLTGEYDALTVVLASGTATHECASVLLKPGYNGIDVSMRGFIFSKIEEVDQVILRFENRGTEQDPFVHRVCVDNVYAVTED